MKCKSCGTEVKTEQNVFCPQCGAEVVSPEEAQALEASISSEDNSFLATVYKHFGGQLFFAGFVLFAVGSLISIALSFATVDTGYVAAYAGITMFFLALTAAFTVVPIIGLWKIYSACGKQDTSSVDGILGGLTLLKIMMMIPNVLLWIVVIILGIFTIWSLFSSFVDFVVLAIVTGTLLLIIKFYFFAFFNIVYSVRLGIQTGNLDKVKGAGSYTIISLISLVLILLSNVMVLVVDPFTVIPMGGFGNELDDVIAAMAQTGGLYSISILASMLSGIGFILMIVVLRKFAKDIKGKGRANGKITETAELRQN